MGIVMKQIHKKNISLPKWSVKEKDLDHFRKLQKSVLKNGQLKNIVVRSIGNEKYEIIDGKLIFSILLEDNSIDYIWCSVVRCSKKEAIFIYLQLDFNADKDFIKIASFIKKLSKKYSLLEISQITDYTYREVEDLINLNNFDFEKYKKQINNQEIIL